MGRSGGGSFLSSTGRSSGGGIANLGGGGGGGGGFHHHHHHYDSSYHDYSYSNRWWYYSYGGRQRVNCNVCAIPFLFFLFIAMIIVVVLVDGNTTFKAYLGRYEQTIVCPQSLRDGKIRFTPSYTGVTTAYLVEKSPSISTTFNITYDKPNSNIVRYGDYTYNSYNLVAGSEIYWDVTTYGWSIIPDKIYLYLVKGADEMDKADRKQDFHYIKYDYSDTISGYYVVPNGDSNSDEYSIILAAPTSSVYVHANYTIKHTRYNVEENTIKKCNSECTFQVSNSDFPPQCVVIEMAGNTSYDDSTVYLSYKLAHSGIFYACIAFCVLGGVGLIACIVACVVCAIRKSKGTQGTTYQNVPSNPAAPAPVPAGYQQPQYNPAAVPAAVPAYNSAPAPAPVYADPNVPTYNTYGTAAPPAY